MTAYEKAKRIDELTENSGCWTSADNPDDQRELDDLMNNIYPHPKEILDRGDLSKERKKYGEVKIELPNGSTDTIVLLEDPYLENSCYGEAIYMAKGVSETTGRQICLYWEDINWDAPGLPDDASNCCDWDNPTGYRWI